MKETYYFSHDYNATQDPKMMALLSTCGLQGVGMYWILIEILHQQPESKMLYKSYEDYIEFYCRDDEQVFNKIKQMLINVGLIIQDGDYIYSNRVLNNKKERERLSELRSKAGKKSAKVRANKTSVEQNLTSVEQEKERKGKEKKVNIYNITLKKQIEPLKGQYAPSLIEDFIDYWDETDQKGKERWKKEKTWDISRRLKRWKRTQDKWQYQAESKQSLKKVDEKPVHRETTVRENTGFNSIGDILR